MDGHSRLYSPTGARARRAAPPAGESRQPGPQHPGTLRIASAYIGTVVGAGFASGQEVLRFFTAYGPWGTVGLLGVTALLAAFGVVVMRLGAESRAESHREIMHAAGGRWLGSFADWVITGFLFAGTAVMMAGSNAIAREQLGWPGWVGSAAMAVASIVTVLFRLRGVTLVTSVVAPLLLVSALAVSTAAVLARGGPAPVQAAPVTGAAPFWPLAALLYASFNLVLAMPVLAPLGAEARDPHVLLRGGLLGGAGLGLAALAIHMALAAGLPATARYEVPMLALARQWGPVAGTVYAVAMWLEIYTTAVTSLYGVAARARSPRRRGFAGAVLLFGALAFSLSFLGFARLVQRLYPLVGYLGLVILGALALRAARRAPASAGEKALAPADDRQGTPAPALGPLPVRAAARAATVLGALLATSALASGELLAVPVPELALWVAAALATGLWGALVVDGFWAAGLGAAVAALGEFGFGSLWLWTGHHLGLQFIEVSLPWPAALAGAAMAAGLVALRGRCRSRSGTGGPAGR
ncbi:MAG TPA: hypothetical protein VIK92_07895 [Thermaerobacter sp.]